MTNLSEVMGIFSDILTKSRFEQQPIKGNTIPRPNPKKNTTPGNNEDDTSVILAKESPRPVPGTSAHHSDPKGKNKPKGRKAGGTFESDASVPDDSTYVVGMEKARMLKAFGVMKSTWGKHGLHPATRRPKTVTEKERDSHADGGERNFSGARGKTPAILGMIKAINRSYRPGQSQHPKFAEEQAKIDEAHKKPAEQGFLIAPEHDPHGDNLPEPTQRGGTRPGSKRKGEIPDGGWKEAALLYPAHRKEQQGGRKVKTRVGDSTGGYPT